MKQEENRHYSEMIAAYDKAGIVYRLAWSLNKSMAMTFGYWDENTTTLAEAHWNLYRVLAEKADIRPTDKVLDAGCAAGGGAIYLAKHIGCHVTGITLSTRQVQMAASFAKREKVQAKTAFLKADYIQTPFKDNSFDVVWAVESLFHAHDKGAFVREAARLLKPGGKLLIADYYLNVGTFNRLQYQRLHEWFEGFSIPNLVTSQQLDDSLVKYGFQKGFWEDISSKVMPSSKRLYRLGKVGLFFLKACSWLPFIHKLPLGWEQIKGTIGQHQSLKAGVWAYKILFSKQG